MLLVEIAVPGPFLTGLDYILPEGLAFDDKVFESDFLDLVSPLAGETGPKMKSRDREGVIAATIPPLCPTGLRPLGLSLPQGERRDHLADRLIGTRVQVPLGKRQVTGVILKVKAQNKSQDKAQLGASGTKLFTEAFNTDPSLPPGETDFAAEGKCKIREGKPNQPQENFPKNKQINLKAVSQILDAEPIYQKALFDLILWMSRYYHHPIGDTFQTALIGALSDPEPLILTPLETYTLTETGQFIYNVHLAPSASPTENPSSKGSLKRSPHQQKLLASLHHAQSHCLSKEEIKTLEIPASAIKSLLEKNWIQQTLTSPLLKETSPTDFPKVLTEEQKEVLKQSLAANKFHVQCLEGITGSGKTEIYLQRIQPLLDAGKQVLILVPEIGLTPQTLKRFENRFKDPVVTLHSGLNAGEKKLAIYHALHGNAKIIIGTRSAVFIPTHNLGMIIIDEEHDLSFKQQNGLRYHARDVAIKRAQLENIPILLGSATLSLETLHNALSQKYLHLKLQQRPLEGTLPTLHRINLKAQKNLIDGLSQPLIGAIKKHLDNQGQVLIFINRRGFAPMLMCHDCGWQAICPRCDKPYTLHIHPSRLSCHHCESQKSILHLCPECDSETPLSDVGAGTEKLELALQTLFPTKKVLRIDRSNTTKKNSMEQHLAQIQSGEADILVGTQMLAKGHHFEGLTMVGIIKIDDALFSNDFRSSEHLGQLLTQVSGRAGRGKVPGEVYIQTHHIDHPLLNLLLTEGYANYAKALLEERKNTNFPPFSYLALVRAEAHSIEESVEALRRIKHYCQRLALSDQERATPSLSFLGPFPAFLAKKGGIYRSQLLFQSQDRKSLHHALNQLQLFLKQNPIKKVRLFFDIDPIELD